MSDRRITEAKACRAPIAPSATGSISIAEAHKQRAVGLYSSSLTIPIV